MVTNNHATIAALAENLRRVFKKMSRELEPGRDEHSTLIDLVNHGDTLAQEIEARSVEVERWPEKEKEDE